jgi:hypothetical protein
MSETAPRKRAIAAESLPEVLAQAVEAAKAMTPRTGARAGVQGLPRRRETANSDGE